MIKTADEFQKVFEEIKLDPQNQEYTEKGIEPLYYANPKANINSRLSTWTKSSRYAYGLE